MKPRFDNPIKQAKLEAAIGLGFIRVWMDTDNEPHYELTERGMLQWAIERQFNA